MTRTNSKHNRKGNHRLHQHNSQQEGEEEDDENEFLIIRIQGNSLTHNTIGYLSLYKITDIIYSIHYDDHIQCLTFDIDSASVDLTKKFLIVCEPELDNLHKRIVFYIPNEDQLELFLEAQQECQDIVNKSLEIATRLRDVYYSGFYSNFKSPVLNNTNNANYSTTTTNNNIFITDELNKLQDTCAKRFTESIELRSHNIEESLGLPSDFSSPNNNQTTIMTQKQMLKDFKHLSNIEPICFYCSTRQPEDEDNFLYIHPYVSMTFQKTPIFMCTCCLENWKVYRDDAQYENELIFPGEINEEICCLCSDSPQTLTLCSACQRSFCADCLKKILTKKDYTTMIENNEPNWRCMACTHHCSPNPPLSRDAWRCWNVNTLSSKASSPTKMSRSQSVTPTSASLKRKNTSDGRLSRQSSRSSFPDLPPPPHLSQPPVYSASSTRSLSPTVSLSSLNQSNISISSSGRVRKINPAVMQFDAPDTPNSLPITPKRRKKRATSREKAIPILDDLDRYGSPTRSAIMIIDRNQDDEKEMNEDEEFIDEDKIDLYEPVTTRGSKAKTKKAQSNTRNSSAGKIDYYYFQQYLDYINHFYLEIIQTLEKQPKRPRIATEETCFLCKDGGELIECDYKYRGQPNQQQHPGMKRCLKVYHEDCLGFTIPENMNNWCCPRHFCSNCGQVENIQFTCMFCPISICSSCPQLFVQKYGVSLYRQVEVFDKRACEVSKETTSIICDNCLIYLNAILKDDPNYLEKLTVFAFGEERSLLDLPASSAVPPVLAIPAAPDLTPHNRTQRFGRRRKGRGRGKYQRGKGKTEKEEGVLPMDTHNHEEILDNELEEEEEVVFMEEETQQHQDEEEDEDEFVDENDVVEDSEVIAEEEPEMVEDEEEEEAKERVNKEDSSIPTGEMDAPPEYLGEVKRRRKGVDRYRY